MGNPDPGLFLEKIERCRSHPQFYPLSINSPTGKVYEDEKKMKGLKEHHTITSLRTLTPGHTDTSKNSNNIIFIVFPPNLGSILVT